METTINNQELTQSWAQLKEEHPKLRIREAAKLLGVAEAALLTTQLESTVTLLNDDFANMLLAFRDLGKVMSLTRNEGCVLEHKGNFQKISIHGTAPKQIATVIGPIEQRVFFEAWKFGFAVVQDTPRGMMRSFQFFDKSGTAIMKVYLQESSNLNVFEDFIDRFKAANQTSSVTFETYEPVEYAKEIDLDAFQSDWENMKDTHDFFGMLRKYKVHRQDAVKWISDDWAYEVDKFSVRRILEKAADDQLPIMIFAGNKGNIQIHQGKVKNIKQMGDWLNVLDPNFNMHLNEKVVDKAYVVHKNTVDGLVSAVELFDAAGELIGQFFGLRKPGLPQNPAWKVLIDSLV